MVSLPGMMPVQGKGGVSTSAVGGLVNIKMVGHHDRLDQPIGLHINEIPRRSSLESNNRIESRRADLIVNMPDVNQLESIETAEHYALKDSTLPASRHSLAAVSKQNSQGMHSRVDTTQTKHK